MSQTIDFRTDPSRYLKAMEEGVEKAFTNIAESMGRPWRTLRDAMREDGRYHVETC